MADKDDELGEAPAFDTDALGDDPGKLKSLIRTLAADGKKARDAAGRRAAALKAAETAFTEQKAKAEALEGETKTLKEQNETANRANGQYRANFKDKLLGETIKAAAERHGAIDLDAVNALLDKSKIAVDDETFAISGVDEAFGALFEAKPYLKKAPSGGDPPPKPGTNKGGVGAGAGAGAGAQNTSYRDATKSLADIERERNIALFGQPTITAS